MIPSQVINFTDGNLGRLTGGAEKPIIIGPTSAGPKNTITTWAQPGKLVDTFGSGLAVDLACEVLRVNGGSIDFIASNAAVDPTVGAVTTAGGVGVDGDSLPHNAYDVAVKIVDDGTLGTSKFRYSLDGGSSWSLPQATAATYAIPATGITLTFAARTYAADETSTFGTTGASMDVDDFNAAFGALMADGRTPSFVFLANDPVTSDDGVALRVALNGAIESYYEKKRYIGAGLVAAGGRDEAIGDVLDAHKAISTTSVGWVAGRVQMAISNSVRGRGTIWTSGIVPVAARLSGLKLSTPGAAVRLGALPNVLDVDWDEAMDGERESADDVHGIGFISYPGKAGYFISQTYLGTVGSDYLYIEDRRVINRAADVVAQVQVNFINSNYATLLDGSGQLDPGEAAMLEGEVRAALDAALVKVTDDFGKPGYVSGYSYFINKENDVQRTGVLESTCTVVVKGKVVRITTDIAFGTAV